MPLGKGYLNRAEKRHVLGLHAVGSYLHDVAKELERSGGWAQGDVVRRLRQAGTLVQKTADMMMAEVDDWAVIKSMARQSARFALEVVER